ncbi:histidine phosphatase superfamily [Polychytrium aggregatum]|uniref:histidine phosphatase superfamily n=1 Tax=Polychytrium aggregatum TaxID=110093 RepID=UPI0022FF3106|nr:histidine phosphatase superfamily [Polychytrium aggregatum]KAI9207204.1 histidine phosphatase superfamily [Polychytrium aggregatum]
MGLGKNVCLVLTLVRHAETDLDTKIPRVLQGQSDTTLSGVGIKQAESLGWRLRKYHFNHIYTSDLQRAIQTTDEIRKHHPSTPVTVEQRLREKNLGDLTGMSWSDAKQILKIEDVHLDDHIGGHGGETKTEFYERVTNFYSDIINQHLIQPHAEMLESIQTLPEETSKLKEAPFSDAASMASMGSLCSVRSGMPKLKQVHVLVVTHGGWIQAFSQHLLQELNFNFIPSDIHLGFPKNTGVYRFTIAKATKPDGDYEWEGSVKLMNCVSHMAGISKKVMKESSSHLSLQSITESPRPIRKVYSKNAEPETESKVGQTAEPPRPASNAIAGGTQRSLGW